jgi:hypothetical protein
MMAVHLYPGRVGEGFGLEFGLCTGSDGGD